LNIFFPKALIMVHS